MVLLFEADVMVVTDFVLDVVSGKGTSGGVVRIDDAICCEMLAP